MKLETGRKQKFKLLKMSRSGASVQRERERERYHVDGLWGGNLKSKSFPAQSWMYMSTTFKLTTTKWAIKFCQTQQHFYGNNNNVLLMMIPNVKIRTTVELSSMCHLIWEFERVFTSCLPQHSFLIFTHYGFNELLPYLSFILFGITFSFSIFYLLSHSLCWWWWWR